MKILFLILLIISLAAIILFSVDFYIKVIRKFKRMKCGNWNNKSVWIKSIANISGKWIIKTPTVKITDNDRLMLVDMIQGKYKSKTIQTWQKASLLLGLQDYLTKNEDLNLSYKIKQYKNKVLDFNSGLWNEKPDHVDGAILAYALLKSCEDKERIKPAMDYMIELINDSIGDDGCVAYRKHILNIRFIDTIGFICPFLTLYSKTYNKPEYEELALKQILTYHENGLLKTFNLPVHAYDSDKFIPLGLYGWGRGLGWYLLGLIDMYKELDYSSKNKIILEKYICEVSKSILQFQHTDGGYGPQIAFSQRYDSSVTAIVGYFFINTYNICGEEIYKLASEKCLSKLISVTRRNGAVDYSQGDTKDIGIYSNNYDIMPFTQGITLRLATMLE